jgi:hypothetical protein
MLRMTKGGEAMSSLAVFCLGLWLGAAAETTGALEFKDAGVFDGRSVLQSRAIEFRQTPAKPLAIDRAVLEGAQYGLLPVGPTPETALAVVWLPKLPGGPELWLDADGDGRLAPAERHVFSGRELERPARITVQLQPEAKQVERTIVFRRSSLGDGLRYAVRGFVQGRIVIGGHLHAMLLIDGNADGCFNSVGHDRVCVDLDDDGRFDPITEQFPLGKPLPLGGQVYVIRSDPLATHVVAGLRSAEQGKLSLSLAGRQPGKMLAHLLSDLGELVTIDKLDQPVNVPTGTYFVSSLDLELTDAAGETWSYAFSKDKGEQHTVTAGQQTSVVLLRALAMQVGFERNSGRIRPGDNVTITPRLTAGDGLVLSRCQVGKDQDFRPAEASAEILLLSRDGQMISRGVTGFS